MTTPTSIDNNGIKINKADNTISTSLTPDNGLEIQYDLLSGNPKTFKISSAGFNYQDNTNNDTTGLQRIALVQQALAAVELPPSSNTLAINKNIQMNYSSDNNIILDQAPNDPIYPLSNPTSDFQTRITKRADDNVEIGQLSNVVFKKNVTPSVNINNLNVTASTMATFSPAPTLQSSIATFPDVNRIIYSDAFAVQSKIFYIQSYSNPAVFNTVDLTSLTTGADNYLAQLPNIFVAQFIPVYYNSDSDCKFFIRMGFVSAAAGLFIITCQGNPTNLASYTYSTNYLVTNTSSTLPIANGVSFGNGTTLTNAQNSLAQRPSILFYDSVNDLFCLSQASSNFNHSYFFVNSSLTQGGNYYLTPPSGYVNTQSVFVSSTYNTFCVGRMYNGNNNAQGTLVLATWDVSTKTLKISPNLVVNTLLTNFFSRGGNNQDSYILNDLSTNLRIYFPYVDSVTLTSQLACFEWDRNIANSPFLSSGFPKQIETGVNTTSYFINNYLSIYVIDINNIQIFSTFSNNFYVSNNNFTTVSTINVPGFNTGYTAFSNPEQETFYQTAVPFSTIYPSHRITRGTGSTPFTGVDVMTLIVTPATQTSQEYLTFDYNLSTNSGTISSTRPMTLSANPLTITGASFTNPPTCSTLPTTNFELTNKQYVDGLITTPTLSAVLSTGNSAGTFDIDMSGNDILNVSNIALSTINGSAYPPASTPSPLSTVLSTGNSAGTFDIDMSGNDILNCNEITSSADLSLNPVGSINLNAKTLNSGGGQIHNVALIHGQNNNDITVEGRGTGDIILKTNNINQVVINDAGVATFTNLPESTTASPTLASQLVTKSHIDNVTVKIAGPQTITGDKTFSGGTTFTLLPESTTASPTLPSQLITKNYVDTQTVLIAGAQTILGDKTFSGAVSIETLATISAQCQMLKFIEQSRGLTGGATVTFDYNLNAGCIGYIATNHTANFQLNITNFPTTYPNGVITLTLLINAVTNKFYANAVTINGGAAETIRFNGGSANINVSSAVWILQTITIVNSSNSRIAVLSSVSPWL